MPLSVARRTNPVWRRHARGAPITMRHNPLFKNGEKFFLMGSCFAEEIRLALIEATSEACVSPDYLQLSFDPKRARVDELPSRNHMNFYNSFSILQELKRCIGEWEQAPDDYWCLEDKFQDPYRRLVIADTPELLHDLNTQLTSIIRGAFEAADHYVFTFGMTEVFFNKSTGLAACQKPGYMAGGGVEETVFKATSFAENLQAVLEISDLISARKPDAKIFITVSPVALARTFSGDDVVVANSLSKSTLRAVLGEAQQLRDNIVYVPSYEAVMSGGRDHFEKDYRHVRRPVVAEVTKCFVEAFMAR